MLSENGALINSVPESGMVRNLQMQRRVSGADEVQFSQLCSKTISTRDALLVSLVDCLLQSRYTKTFIVGYTINGWINSISC